MLVSLSLFPAGFGEVLDGSAIYRRRGKGPGSEGRRTRSFSLSGVRFEWRKTKIYLLTRLGRAGCSPFHVKPDFYDVPFRVVAADLSQNSLEGNAVHLMMAIIKS